VARVHAATESLREALVGAQLPLMFHHADLRAKHLIIDDQAKVRATLDFGSAEPEFLPLVDLLHHLGHQRKQKQQCSAQQAWQELRNPATRSGHEQQALEEQAQTLNIETPIVEAMLDAYPLFVAGMAEANWDWSRPEWIHREFGW
jgi:aminoglycoside phosphotransferase (APT) family kinase protein